MFFSRKRRQYIARGFPKDVLQSPSPGSLYSVGVLEPSSSSKSSSPVCLRTAESNFPNTRLGLNRCECSEASDASWFTVLHHPMIQSHVTSRLYLPHGATGSRRHQRLQAVHLLPWQSSGPYICLLQLQPGRTVQPSDWAL